MCEENGLPATKRPLHTKMKRVKYYTSCGNKQRQKSGSSAMNQVPW